MRLLCSGWVLLTATVVGCRTMPAEERSFPQTRTYHAATHIDPEPHVLTITVHAPTCPLDYTSPRRLHMTVLRNTGLQLVEATAQQYANRTLGIHNVGHVLIELKSVDRETGRMRYLLTAVTADSRETGDQALRGQLGYSILDRGVTGRLESYDRVGTDLDESAELGVPSARLRVLVSPETADRMFHFHADFVARGIYRRFAIVSDPLAGDGASCASLAAGFLEAGGLLTAELRAAWQHTLPVPDALVGDPEAGKRVPIRRLLLGPAARRWAEPCEPHRRLTYYDTTLMHAWVVRHAAPSSGVECQLERLLAMPVATLDARHVPTPTGPIFR